jgi:hypothetical protein
MIFREFTNLLLDNHLKIMEETDRKTPPTLLNVKILQIFNYVVTFGRVSYPKEFDLEKAEEMTVQLRIRNNKGKIRIVMGVIVSLTINSLIISFRPPIDASNDEEDEAKDRAQNRLAGLYVGNRIEI